MEGLFVYIWVMGADKTTFPIKDWATDDRPREKLQLHGHSTLSDTELLAILIGSGTRDATAVDLAKDLMKRADNNLIELGKLSVEDLKKIRGIGEAKAISIVAALEVGRRRAVENPLVREKITGSRQVFDLFRGRLSDLRVEEFWVLLLDHGKKELEKFNVSKGGVSATVADRKVVFKRAIDRLASNIILVHNHPSGSAYPSQSDLDMTQKFKGAGLLMDCPVLDHIIIAENKYYSFADEGVL